MNGEKKGKFSDSLDKISSIFSIFSSVISIIKDKKALIGVITPFAGVFFWLFKKWNDTTSMERVFMISLLIVCALAIAGWNFYFNLRKKEAAEAEAKDKELAESTLENQKLKGKITDLEQKNSDIEQELERKGQEICGLHEKSAVLEKVLHSKIPPQVGFYVTNKKNYDDFKTELQLQECTLEVRLPKPDPSQSGHNMHFRWTLVVKNNRSEPAKTVHFIYSGEKGLHPTVFIKEGTRETHVTASLKLNEFTGDDCFIEIKLPNPIKCGTTATIIVEYTPRAYQFRQPFDTIWLAPDALGFASVSEFCIRVFHDHEIIVPGTTNCILRTYQSSGNYSAEDDQLIIPSKQGEETVLQCDRKDEDDSSIQDHAYLLALINDWNMLPPYLHDMRTQCDRQQS